MPGGLCDALAEELSLLLSRFYLDWFGSILRHNMNKVLRRGGQARATFGGGEELKPIEIYSSGRATCLHRVPAVPIEDLAV